MQRSACLKTLIRGSARPGLLTRGSAVAWPISSSPSPNWPIPGSTGSPPRMPAPARAASGLRHAGAGTGAPGRRGRPPAEVPAGPRQAPESGEFPRLESSAEFPSLEALDRARPGRPRPGRRAGAPAGQHPQASKAEAADTVSDRRVRPAPRERTPREARRARKRVSNRALIAVAAAAVVGGAAFVLLTGHNHGVPHVVTAPNALGSYVKQPQLAIQMQAKQLQHDIVTQSAGEAKNVVYAVYEDSTESGAKTAPQIVLFIGGNTRGTSRGLVRLRASAASYPGAVTTSSRAPWAATPPASRARTGGSWAECAWADNDTFGVVASPTLNAHEARPPRCARYRTRWSSAIRTGHSGRRS